MLFLKYFFARCSAAIARSYDSRRTRVRRPPYKPYDGRHTPPLRHNRPAIMQ